MLKSMRRDITMGTIIVLIAGASWLGLRYYRSQSACKQRNVAFARQMERIKDDAHERLKVGANKADVARFFADHSMQVTTFESEATGTLETSGCAPFGCGKDSALIAVRVKLSPEGAVMEEPTVMSMYTDCL